MSLCLAFLISLFRVSSLSWYEPLTLLTVLTRTSFLADIVFLYSQYVCCLLEARKEAFGSTLTKYSLHSGVNWSLTSSSVIASPSSPVPLIFFQSSPSIQLNLIPLFLSPDKTDSLEGEGV
eukprot:CAMPEP_0118671044 /NCGR_PEP_ID=MMETSP0785-20121206/21791_1 /TAXON_ID=91992 /ORGANISM="Bolidomonas pacifica, Strain CCMP 1866" /LENGTH=120 /DNA_ID=CAMNT_0006565901 /DNA_START=299 /DNA_END=661 /DNA_ORIENTATION=+